MKTSDFGKEKWGKIALDFDKQIVPCAQYERIMQVATLKCKLKACCIKTKFRLYITS